MVCLLGQTVARELFDEESPVGQEVYVNDVPLRVVGVLSRKGADIIGEDQDDMLARALDDGQVPGELVDGIPRRDVGAAPVGSGCPAPARRIGATPADTPRSSPTRSPTQALATPRLDRLSNVDSILVRASSTEDIPAAMDEINRVLRERHRIAPGEPDDFAVRDFTEVVHAVQGTVGLVAGLLLCVALIALVVGGIGIMNIMLVTVTERLPRDRPAHGRGRAIPRHPPPVPRRGRRPLPARGAPSASSSGGPPRSSSVSWPDWPTEPSLIAVAGVGLGLGHRRRDLRLLPRLEGLAARPDRSPAVRVTVGGRFPARGARRLPRVRASPCRREREDLSSSLFSRRKPA